MDVVPATNFMQQFVAQTNHALAGMWVRGRKIPVQYIDSSNPLGTQDGQNYSIVPADDGDVSDEDGQHGK